MKLEVGMDPFKLVGQPLKKYGFSMDKKATAQALRDFADDVENSHVLLQRVRRAQDVDYDDYQMNTVTLKFVTKRNDDGENS